MINDVDIIIFDDDPDIGVLMHLIFSDLGYKMAKFDKVPQFLLFMQHNNPKLIIMDMLLSGADGRDICKKIKADPLKKHINILMCSAHPDAEKTCIAAGADAFIEKPFTLNQFITQVKKFVDV